MSNGDLDEFKKELDELKKDLNKFIEAMKSEKKNPGVIKSELEKKYNTELSNFGKGEKKDEKITNMKNQIIGEFIEKRKAKQRNIKLIGKTLPEMLGIEDEKQFIDDLEEDIKTNIKGKKNKTAELEIITTKFIVKYLKDNELLGYTKDDNEGDMFNEFITDKKLKGTGGVNIKNSVLKDIEKEEKKGGRHFHDIRVFDKEENFIVGIDTKYKTSNSSNAGLSSIKNFIKFLSQRENTFYLISTEEEEGKVLDIRLYDYMKLNYNKLSIDTNKRINSGYIKDRVLDETINIDETILLLEKLEKNIGQILNKLSKKIVENLRPEDILNEFKVNLDELLKIPITNLTKENKRDIIKIRKKINSREKEQKEKKNKKALLLKLKKELDELLEIPKTKLRKKNKSDIIKTRKKINKVVKELIDLDWRNKRASELEFIIKQIIIEEKKRLKYTEMTDDEKKQASVVRDKEIFGSIFDLKSLIGDEYFIFLDKVVEIERENNLEFIKDKSLASDKLMGVITEIKNKETEIFELEKRIEEAQREKQEERELGIQVSLFQDEQLRKKEELIDKLQQRLKRKELTQEHRQINIPRQRKELTQEDRQINIPRQRKELTQEDRHINIERQRKELQQDKGEDINITSQRRQQIQIFNENKNFLIDRITNLTNELESASNLGQDIYLIQLRLEQSSSELSRLNSLGDQLFN
jgi:hypothetical protein